jgi:hypothetical protein
MRCGVQKQLGQGSTLRTVVWGFDRQFRRSPVVLPPDTNADELKELLKSKLEKRPRGVMTPKKYVAPVIGWNPMLFLPKVHRDAVQGQEFGLELPMEIEKEVLMPSIPTPLRRMLQNPGCKRWYDLVAHSIPSWTLESYLEYGQADSMITRSILATLHKKIHERLWHINSMGVDGYDWEAEPHNLAGLKYTAIVVALDTRRMLVLPSESPTGLLLLLTAVFRLPAVQAIATSWQCIQEYMAQILRHFTAQKTLDKVDWAELCSAHTWAPFPRLKHDNSPHLANQNYVALMQNWRCEFTDSGVRRSGAEDGLSPEDTWWGDHVARRAAVMEEEGMVFESEDHKCACVSYERSHDPMHFVSYEIHGFEAADYGKAWNDNFFNWNIPGCPLAHCAVRRPDIDIPRLVRT